MYRISSIILVFSICLITACSKDELSIFERIDEFDPIRDPIIMDPDYSAPISRTDNPCGSFLWYLDNVKIDIYAENGSSMRIFPNEFLPWNTSGNPIGNDYKPEDGWELYLLDFGNPQRGAKPPFFALYNKYRGILRFFVFNYKYIGIPNPDTYFTGKLQFRNPPSTGAKGMFSFTAEPGSNTYKKADANSYLVSTGSQLNSGRWLIFDFNIVGISTPSISDILQFQIFSVRKTEATFNFTGNYSFSGNISEKDKPFKDFVTNGYYIGKNSSDLLKNIDKLFSNSNSTNKINPIDVLKFGTDIFGVIKAFAGNKTIPSTIKGQGEIDAVIDGNLILTNPQYDIDFHPNYRAELNGLIHVTCYEKSTGIISIHDEPVINRKVSGYAQHQYVWNRLTVHDINETINIFRDTDGFNIDRNWDLGNSMTRVKAEVMLIPRASYTRYFPFNDQWVPFNNLIQFQNNNPEAYNFYQIYPQPLFDKIAIRTTFRINDQTNFDNEIIFVQLINIKRIITDSSEFYIDYD